MAEPKDERFNGWRFEKSLSWGEVVTSLMIVIGCVIAFKDMDSRIQTNGERIANIGNGQASLHSELTAHISAEDSKREAIRTELRSELRDINLKLDRLIERQK